MAEFPALPFFTDAYLADTRHLTTEEHGAYILLLMCAWRTRGCMLKDDDRSLARMAGLSPARWRRVRPVLLEFFTVTDGVWHQGKLSQVYETVAKKVERNRQNGAKGGRARAYKQQQPSDEPNILKNKRPTAPSARFVPGWNQTIAKSQLGSAEQAGDQATRTKSKTKSESRSIISPSEGQMVLEDATVKAVVTAAALEGDVDFNVILGWLSAGANLKADILPTIKRLYDRELVRTGKAPFHLGYYSPAILEAMRQRVEGNSPPIVIAPSQPRIRFQSENTDHWRQFLGDADNRFRGDYLSAHWHIPQDHPAFLPVSLGADPRHRPNDQIPDEIYEEYAANWSWRPRQSPKQEQVKEDMS